MGETFPTPDLDGKVALVTGGAGGLGAATCRELAAAGARVVVSDLAEDAGEAVAHEVDGAFFACDVSDLEQNRGMVDFAVDRFGGLDLVYLNAGISTGCGVGEDFDPEKYRRAMGANIDGVVFGAVAAIPALKTRGGGSILATASLAGLTAVPFDPIYAANKHAVVGLARSLGPGLIADGIRFNAICPGFAESAIIADIKEALIGQGIPIIPAESVAETAVHLLSSELSGECWFVQAGREPAAFQFRNLPGPRAD